jgi:hypothetical protein
MVNFSIGYPRESVVDDNQIVIPRLPENLANAKNDTQGLVDVINGNWALAGGNQGWADVSWVI